MIAHLNNRRGVASVMFIIYLPVLLMIMALVIDVGLLIVIRNKLQAAADFGALAGAQNLNVQALQEGSIILDDSSAKRDATEWAEENVLRNLHPFMERLDLIITARVYNGSAANTLYDWHTGRAINDPTVCIVIEAVHQFYFIHGVFGDQWITVHADASVMTKE